MKRYDFQPSGSDYEINEGPEGEFVKAEDVDAFLVRLRALAKAWRSDSADLQNIARRLADPFEAAAVQAEAIGLRSATRDLESEIKRMEDDRG